MAVLDIGEGAEAIDLQLESVVVGIEWFLAAEEAQGFRLRGSMDGL